MTCAEEKTYKFICRHHSNFCHVDVLEILPYLPCLTPSDQDRLRASYTRLGNRDTLWDLFNTLQRRTGWVEYLVGALRTCELSGLADQVNRVYQSSQPGGTPSQAPGPVKALEVPAEVPAAHNSGTTHSVPHNGYREEPSYPWPVQDTQPPESPRESSEQVPQTTSLGAIPRRPSGSLEPSSDLPALSPLTPSRHQEQNPKLGSTQGTGPVSSPTSPRGPVSPTVSFQPLARATPRVSRLPGPAWAAAAMSVSPSFSSSPSSTSSPSTGSAGNQARASTCPSEVPTEVPTNSVTTSSVPSPTTLKPVTTMTSKVPASPAPVSIVPSKVPTSLKPPGANVLTNPAPSKLPINSARAGIMPSKVPTSMVSTKAPNNTVLSTGSSTRAKEIAEAPAPTATIGASSPWPKSSSGDLQSSSEMSKPGELQSQQYSQPYSGCSADLAISPSSSLASEPTHGPEENEYASFGIRVAEDPSANLMAVNPEPCTVLQAQKEEKETNIGWSVSWTSWLGAAVASALLGVLLAVLYRRRSL
ncbi:mitochondrial antiviral-signaling protein [Heterocephalus glaber]|uniref:Mitochondrial antiviral-signaling protein n=1 Tax=Heterocephalus glaber TaxID=10181 RepID=A0AAX6QV86_HETGA|nr:mitochondrial antiviral-signaling protein [Heterocephalus glaber]XP_004840808.1 mitochondrial antiviral-signaling protein [Heterocephalus glaber]XP_004840809.1 mitochondrial antiviral-signaling protein [Heterocephalus glaber]XP_004840810.1 mitochondrial antiviral-signaling protein [Heterocephalus glaber]XP_004840811.1 mitochondrial antiviral-signaling protein [Heterocephalus glaber]XP_004840812.1 mitochondrial antiviral-signaling protein [Heterocephalus glaber]XP_012926163.1 mitochondrial 